MFRGCYNLETFSAKLPKLTSGYDMFNGCKLTSWNIALPSLTEGINMFGGCDFTSWNINLPKLSNGQDMFFSCSQLTTFSSKLPSLTNGSCMFSYCRNLTSFNANLSSLTDGSLMFQYCENLTSFNSDLSSLINGRQMFQDCTKLTSFTSDLSSLTNGYDMFYYCKLNTSSVQNIADTIKNVSSLTEGFLGIGGDVYKTIHIGIGNSSPNSTEEAAFNTIASKGWTVYVGVNGGNPSQWTPTDYGYVASASLASSLTTLDETGESEMFNPKPYWAKPVPSNEEHAKYVDAQGNFYNILGGNYIYGDNLENYGMFTSLEDAAAQMRLTKIEK
jgi:hypothetical protein